MLLIPAIDIKDGQCVRLEQGRMDKATVFSGEPGKAAAQWASKGARRLHVVDLNGAVADFVQEDCPAARQLQDAPFLSTRVSKGALLISKQLAFE